MVFTCSIKCTVSLARIKIRLEFESMEAFCTNTKKESKGDPYLHKFRSCNCFVHGLRLGTNVYKLFVPNWLGITVPRDNFVWNGRFGPNIARTNTYSFVGLRKTSHSGTILCIWKGIWLFKIMKIILFS